MMTQSFVIKMSLKYEIEVTEKCIKMWQIDKTTTYVFCKFLQLINHIDDAVDEHSEEIVLAIHNAIKYLVHWWDVDKSLTTNLNAHVKFIIFRACNVLPSRWASHGFYDWFGYDKVLSLVSPCCRWPTLTVRAVTFWYLRKSFIYK